MCAPMCVCMCWTAFHGMCACLVRVCLSVSESSAGVGDRDDGGAQSEQGGQEMGNQGGQGTQEYHSLQESKPVSLTHSCLSHILTSEYPKQIQTLFLIK